MTFLPLLIFEVFLYLSLDTNSALGKLDLLHINNSFYFESPDGHLVPVDIDVGSEIARLQETFHFPEFTKDNLIKDVENSEERLYESPAEPDEYVEFQDYAIGDTERQQDQKVCSNKPKMAVKQTLKEDVGPTRADEIKR